MFLQINNHYICLDFTEIYGSMPDVVKIAHADITKVLIEAAKHDSDLEGLFNLLQCTTLTRSCIDKLCKCYFSYKEQIKEFLESIGSALPHIIDVDWQLNYCVKSSTNYTASLPMYNMSLSTIKNGKVECVKFVCTIQEVQELVCKLKDTARHLEKLTTQ
ncbi:COMM domain-containing protein 3 isoform X1 [Copidosoma floridanum]|uniref:COMM domain-containing protein 3 isoform X1 n=2 Tax=Copidosoma floridanum TaxID=29053 RepID=UPI000C6FC8FC|nr:COMM domain-containing protein 3 isoform X1 [Copidosoma floridanum]